MALSWFPRETDFFATLEAITEPLGSTPAALAGGSTAGASALDLLDRMVDELDKTFVTPFDREDLFAVAASLTEVRLAVDGLAAHTGRGELGARESTLGAIHEACGGLDRMVKLLRSFAKHRDEAKALLATLRRGPAEAEARLRRDRSATPGDPATDDDLLRVLDRCGAAVRSLTVLFVKGA